MKILHSKILNKESSGTPLLILHGLFGMLDNWQTMGKKLSQTRPVHLIDLRNHGRSFWDNEMNLQVMAQDLREYILYHSLEKIHLLGHSLGGKVALQFLEIDKNQLEKLIIADIALRQYKPHHQEIIDTLKKLELDKLTNRKEIDIELSRKIHNIAIKQFLLKNMYLDNNKKYNFRFNLEVIDVNYSSLLSEITPHKTYQLPILFIRGERSSYIIEEDTLTIKKYYPNNLIKTIEKTGHWLHSENPDEFYRNVEYFLKEK